MKKTLSLYACLFVMAILSVSASAANFVVTKTADTNDGVCDADCSLREAVGAANTAAGDDTINFDPTVFSFARTITLSAGELNVVNNGSLTVNGPALSVLHLRGNSSRRIFFVQPNAYVR